VPRAIALGAALVVVAAAGWLAGIEPPPGSGTVAVEAIPKPGVTVRLSASANYIGVSGCTAAACHGGPVSADPRLPWQSSYTIWASPEPHEPAPNGKPENPPLSGGQLVDKHNRAYATLFDERSKRIVQLLDRLPDIKSAAPPRDARCTVCHSVPVDPKTAPVSILADGVGCELCHGPAKNWLREHTQNAWLDGYHAGKPVPLSDMKDTRDLFGRAQLCASCHVGDPQLGRDVNHDLIAAGHPRLNFEFHAYLGVMPKHWADAPGAKIGFKTDRETHAEAWAIGQLVSAEAALRLLAARAESADKQTGSHDTAQSAPWPEFAEYGCYACHHQLDSKRPSPRQKTVREGASRTTANSLPWSWGTWYFPDSELRLLLESDLLANSPEAKRVLDLVNQLRGEMSKPSPSVRAVHEMAEKAAGEMELLAKQVATVSLDAHSIDALLERAADEHFDPADWDQAAERFLTIEALWKAHQYAHPQAAASGDAAAASAAIEQLRDQLQFPRPPNWSVPGRDSKPSGIARIDSPTTFDPQAVAERFKLVGTQIRKLLPRNDRP
jgi:Cytochrome c554 and c-prime